ncbi:MAG: ABC transporter permease [Clostridia bacterium]|jgi:tungstate transport system permease protein|nr:ABC transporter permease [Clostridia bacterium]MDH7573936.1 ABC transporter permease [Clostridia bacterium]
MEFVLQGLIRGFHLLFSLDPEVVDITLRTLQVTGSATLVSVLLGVPLGVFLALKRFWGRGALLSLVYSGMGLPPTVVGLWVSLFLWRSGPLGDLKLIYTPAAMVIAQAVIATPLVASLTAAALQQLPPKLRLQILALGASRWQLIFQLLREARLGILAAVIAGFGGVVSEVGAAAMVGGNIVGETRVLTTAIMLEVSRGNFDLAIALSFILLALVYAVVALLARAQQPYRSPGS